MNRLRKASTSPRAAPDLMRIRQRQRGNGKPLAVSAGSQTVVPDPPCLFMGFTVVHGPHNQMHESGGEILVCIAIILTAILAAVASVSPLGAASHWRSARGHGRFLSPPEVRRG